MNRTTENESASHQTIKGEQTGDGNYLFSNVSGGEFNFYGVSPDSLKINANNSNPAKKEQNSQITELPNDRYSFSFSVDIEGRIEDISIATANALRKWFYDEVRGRATANASVVLRDTFSVVISDSRLSSLEKSLRGLESKIESNGHISEREEKYYAHCSSLINAIHHENNLKTEALSFFFADTVGHGIIYIRTHTDLRETISKIMNYFIDEEKRLENDKYICLDIFLNSNANNDKTESFLAFLEESAVKEQFGGATVYDVYMNATMDLGKLKAEVLPYYYFFLARLRIDERHDFPDHDKRLNFMNYFICLH